MADGCQPSAPGVVIGTCPTNGNCDAEYAAGDRLCIEVICPTAKKCTGPGCGGRWRCGL